MASLIDPGNGNALGLLYFLGLLALMLLVNAPFMYALAWLLGKPL